MKLATLKNGLRDGQPAVVDGALERCVSVSAVVPSVERALEDWDRFAPTLAEGAPERAGRHIKALMPVNDVSLRALVPGELAKGFGVPHSKPASAFSPVTVMPDELGAA
jgi:hypothetical protein